MYLRVETTKYVIESYTSVLQDLLDNPDAQIDAKISPAEIKKIMNSFPDSDEDLVVWEINTQRGDILMNATAIILDACKENLRLAVKYGYEHAKEATIKMGYEVEKVGLAMSYNYRATGGA